MLEAAIKNPFPNAKSYYQEISDSTMILAKTLVKNKLPSGSLVYTSYQISGRGRTEGRKWLGSRDQSLLFTIVFKISQIPFQITLFPLFAGWALSKVLEREFKIVSEVKWPNDVLVEGHKISGILCECYDDYIACGIGVNLLQNEFSETLRRKSCSVFSITGLKVSDSFLLEKLLQFMYENLSDVHWTEDLISRLYKKGENITVLSGLADKSEPIQAVIQGIGEYGQLLIKEENGKTDEIFAGEILF